MPINVTLSADELKALLAMREEHALRFSENVMSCAARCDS